MNHYYQPSNRFSVGGVLLLLSVGGVAAALLAFTYVYAVWYIPFIYVNFLLTLGFGFLLGVVLTQLVRTGKLRNPVLATILAAGVGLVACYVQWALYLTLMFNMTSVESFGRRASVAHTSFSADVMVGILLNPGSILEAMSELAASGSWSLMGVTPSGIFLYLIWLVEAAVIVGAPVLLVRNQATEPFSETANEWAEEEELPVLVAHISDPAATRASLEADDFSALRPLAEDPERMFARLKLHCAPNDTACAFLSLENVTVSIDDKAKESETTTNVVEYLRVSAQRCQELRRSYCPA
jgi:hypothetical protein